MRNYREILTMPERTEYLTHNEKELLARRSEFERADAIQNVALLSLRLSDTMGDTVERVRLADLELVKKLGSKAYELLNLLDALPAIESPAQEIVEAVIEVKIPTEVTVENIGEIPEVILDEDISPKGRKWLEKGIGSDWAIRLDVAPSASAESIAAAILRFAPPRKPITIELATARIAAKLEGKTMKEIIASSTVEGTPAAVYQYLHKVLERVESTAMGTISIIPEGIEGVVTEKILPKSTELSEVIGSRLDFNGAEIMALRSFLDPKTKSDMTTAKEIATQKVREEIRHKIDNSAYRLSQFEKQYIRKSFGVYFFSDLPQDHPPIAVNELIEGSRQSNQKSEIPGYIQSGLRKLFIDANEVQSQHDAFIQAAISLESMTDEAFDAQRNELFSNLENDSILSNDQVIALRRRAQFGDKNEYMSSDQMLRGALRIIEGYVVEAGGVNSGNALIDTELKRFISPNMISSHLDALRAQLPEDLRKNPQAIERIIAAGLYAVYKQINERAA